MYQVFSHPPGQPRKILGYFPGHTPGQAIAVATVALSMPAHAPHIKAWIVLTRHLEHQKAYISIKPTQGGNEGAISNKAHNVYVDCRQFLGKNGHNALYERMTIDGMIPNKNSGHVMGKGSGSGYVGYKQFGSEQQAISYLLNLAFILPLYDQDGALISTFHPCPQDEPNSLPANSVAIVLPSPVIVPAPRVARNDRAPQLLEVPPATTPPTLIGPDDNPGNLVRALVDWIQSDPYKAPDQRIIVQGWDQRIKTYAYAIKGNPNAWPAVYNDTAPLIYGLKTIVNANNWNGIHGPHDLNQADNLALLNLADKVRVWGGVNRPKDFMDAWNVIKSAVLNTRNNKAPMNSGWTKIASFASDGLPNAQTIWDSRVSTSVIWRFDKILHSNLLTPQSILGHYKLGLVKGRSNPTGPRGRHYQFLGGWPWGNGKWICHLDGGKLVRDMVATLNNHALNYPRMPLPNGGSGDWDVFGVGLVLFMDGY